MIGCGLRGRRRHRLPSCKSSPPTCIGLYCDSVTQARNLVLQENKTASDSSGHLCQEHHQKVRGGDPAEVQVSREGSSRYVCFRAQTSTLLVDCMIVTILHASKRERMYKVRPSYFFLLSSLNALHILTKPYLCQHRSECWREGGRTPTSTPPRD